VSNRSFGRERRGRGIIADFQLPIVDLNRAARFIDGHEWVLEVWVRQNGVWRVVATQVNIAKP